MLASCDTGQVRCRNFTSRISSRGGEKKMNGRANPRPTVLHYALGRFVYNIEGQTSQLLPVMRPILTAERGRRDRRGVLWLPRAPSSSYVDGCATPYAKVQWVRGAFFCSCSVHMAYRSAPCRAVSSCVHALVLQEVITARKRLAAFTYEGCQKKDKTRHRPESVVEYVKKGGKCGLRGWGTYVRFSCVWSDITCRLRCSARAKLLEQPGTAQMCVRSRASSGSGTLRPRLFLIKCGTGAGGGMRLRGVVSWVFRSGEGWRSMTGLVPAVGGGEYFSSIFAVPTFFFAVAAAADVSL